MTCKQVSLKETIIGQAIIQEAILNILEKKETVTEVQ